MERRKAVKNIGLSFGTIVASPSILSLFQSCAPTEAPWIPTFFTEEEGKVMKNLADAILPAIDGLPSATEVGVHIFIDKYINMVMDAEDQKVNKGSLNVVMNSLKSSTKKDNISRLKMANYEDFLNANLRKSKEEIKAINKQIQEYMKANKNDPTDMPSNLRIYMFLSRMRNFIIFAYKISERVGKTILAYQPIPGEQRGCVDMAELQEVTGGKAWSL